MTDEELAAIENRTYPSGIDPDDAAAILFADRDALLAEVKRLRAENERIESLLFYAIKNYVIDQGPIPDSILEWADRVAERLDAEAKEGKKPC